MFYFQQLLNQGLSGIDRTPMVGIMVGIAYTVLLIGFLIGLYSAAMRGGDLQALAVTAIKYLVVAIILANWSTVFREVNSSFNSVAQSMDAASGAGDMFASWMDQLKQQFQSDGSTSFFSLIQGGLSALTTVLLVFVAYLIYALAVIVFGFFYTLYGCVLYVLGPIVLALLPMPGVSPLAKSFATNLFIWNSWGLLYAIFGSLITAIQANRIDDLLNGSGFMGFFVGQANTVVLGLISIFYALALMLIPFIAKKIVSGDVGATAYSMVRAAAVAAGAAMSAGAGFAAGAGGASGGPGAGSSAGASGAGGGAGASSAGATSSSTPPPQPSLAGTIRSGVSSAMNGGAPPSPSSGSSSPEGSSSNSGSSSGSSGSNGSGKKSSGSSSSQGSGGSSGFRPVGVAQTVAFHAGRMAGQAVGNAANGDDKKSA
ncbi:MAG: hypothetical protein WA672_01620 [Candidatus Angelobacter sp.]